MKKYLKWHVAMRLRLWCSGSLSVWNKCSEWLWDLIQFLWVLNVGLFTLAGREKHVAILAVHSTESFLLVCVLVGYIVWQKTAKEQESISCYIKQHDSSCEQSVIWNATKSAIFSELLYSSCPLPPCLLRHLLCADTAAFSMGKAGASTSALFSLKTKEPIRKENIKLANNTEE